MWSSFVATYRRKVTTASDRKTNVILAISDPTKPAIQNITAGEVFLAFNSMLCPRETVGTSACQAVSTEWQLTEWISSALMTAVAGPFVSDPLDYLRDLFMTPLYIYNPQMDGIGIGPVPAIGEIVSGLPDENYINGSLARPMNHLVISTCTIISYISVGGILLFWILVLLAVTITRQVLKTSNFPVVDFSTLSVAVQEGTDQPEFRTSLEELFRNCEAGDNEGILAQSAKAEVHSMRQPKPP